MSYQVLARKWRPRTFSEMVGQEHVVRALSNALDNDRLHHAYLFTGTRGVGKTTLARILAKSLNCEKGVSASPCGECSACREVDEGRFADLIEVDAASRTRVDETRELLENVPFAPIRGRYKVYLIDEVHMFSVSSFNALLKTLEEPPPHVKFLLATTDPQKVPVTVLSRCLQLNLKRLPVAQIQAQFEHILQAESVEWEAPALALLARAADGSMRDGLSLLDQAIGYGGGAVREADVQAMLGVLARDRLPELMSHVAEQDAAGALSLVAAIADESPDFAALTKELVTLLHRVALLQAAPEIADESWGDPAPLQKLAGRFHPEEIQLFYEIALRGQRDLPLAPDPRSGFEMLVLRMIAFRPDSAPATAPAPKSGGTEAKSNRTAKPAENRHSPSTATANVSGGRDLQAENWHEVVAKLGLSGISAQLAAHCTVKQWDGKRLLLGLDADSGALLVGNRATEKLQQTLSDWLGKPVKVEIELDQAAVDTPAQRAAREAAQHRREVLHELKQDPVVRMLETDFDASLREESLELNQKNSHKVH